jgi:hypothetical protein
VKSVEIESKGCFDGFQKPVCLKTWQA